MSRRGRARLLLAAAGCAALVLSGAGWSAGALACLAGLGAQAVLPYRRGRKIPDAAVVLAHTLLLAAAFWLAVARNPPLPLLHVLLGYAPPFLLICALSPGTLFNEFLILLVSLLLAAGSAALADGLRPLWVTAFYLLVLSQALPALTARRLSGDPAVRVRLLGRGRSWSRAPLYAAHHIALAGLLLGAGIYLLAPRFAPSMRLETSGRDPRLLAGRERRAGRASASKHATFPVDLTIGDLGRLKRSRTIAFKAQLRLRGRPYDPGIDERSMLLLRARVWVRYIPAEARWERAVAERRRVPFGGRIASGAGPVDWSIRNEGYAGLALFVPQRARRLRAAVGPLYFDASGNASAAVSPERYGVEAAVPITRPADLAHLEPDRSRSRLLAVPEELARKLRPYLPESREGSLGACVLAVRRYFAERGFRYTLDLPAALPAGTDPLLAFLDRKEGHCELYATAGCLFLRMLGIPARTAGGMRCAERVGPGNYVVRFSNAHAWVEIACRSVGFVAVDFTPADDRATPSGGRGSDATPAAGADAEEGTDAGASFDWRRPFNYGAMEQRSLFRRVRRTLPSGPFLMLLCGGALLGAGLWGALRSRGAAAGIRRRGMISAKTLGFYARWLRACADQGHRRRRNQTPREFLAGLPAELRAQGGAVTRKFERLRYGPGGDALP